MPTETTIEPGQEHNDDSPQPSVTDFGITGMTCGNCARHVTEALQSVAGVRSATVDLEAGQASVRWAQGTQADVAAAIRAVEEAGYGAKVMEAHHHEHAEHHKLLGWQMNLWIGVLGTAPLMMGEWV